MTDRIQAAGLNIASELYAFTQTEALPYSHLTSTDFFAGMAKIVQDFSGENAALLEKRDDLQSKIDQWYQQHAKTAFDYREYKNFLTEIGYLENTPEDFTIETKGVDSEISDMAGPQLVVPILNARFAINAANARWGSLYDALYGTDAISTENGAEVLASGYNPIRGAQVISETKKFLDDILPLTLGSHAQVTAYHIYQGALMAETPTGTLTLIHPETFIAYRGTEDKPSSLLFIHNGLHIDILIDPNSAIGKTDSAGVKDIILESAITTIMDFEDSVAAVDAADKVLGYRNWLGLNTGELTAEISKGGKTSIRKLNPDREYISLKDGKPLILPGRSLLFVRNVGLHMLSDAILDSAGNPIYEGIIDAVYTVLCALPGLSDQGLQNSRTGSIYVVKPKMHSPAEVAFAVKIFSAVEDLFHLPRNTIKIGIMDEERRMTVNLKAAIKAAYERVAFINTGFLDRTGDEIHSSMLAGVFVPKEDLKKETWYKAYEESNVQTGLAAGLSHKAQIGKGMWAMPDRMADLLTTKIQQPMAGATTAWVPSPTAATLHATHYHKINVFERHKELLDNSHPSDIDSILRLPIIAEPDWDKAIIQAELDSNTQSILGYVTRWVEQGIGCSKVPDMHNIGLMEDRATLRISSQILANWLYHGVITEEDIIESLKKMALVVDQQNAGDSHYIAMAPNFDDSIAFQAAKDLILQGAKQPNGYTEPILHKRRKEFKLRHKLQ